MIDFLFSSGAVFYLFAAVAVFAASMMVFNSNPVRAALFLVLTFFAASGLWILVYAEFLALVLVLVYVGAVMTLFLFVIMMLNVRIASGEKRFARYWPLGLVFVAALVALMVTAFLSGQGVFSNVSQTLNIPAGYNNIRELGSVLYTDYAYVLEIAAVLLLVAIIAAITLVHRGSRSVKTQNITQQIMVSREDRLRLVDMDSGDKES